ncbi:unnamed protein product [Prorocentrum cordatum]|uniref:Polycystin cation channel PKD1/PKD2 domain-containing protein n=1 Tax=Prorocentrum cordatum TaxID=2364126 RepID=A0ABN9X6F2_9DINO|nr:unnamed protein product [Polarella glacialis]
MSGKLFSYGCYVLAFFVGFYFFAIALFGHRYAQFHTEGRALATTMELFFGDVTTVEDVSGGYFLLFLVGFLIAFYIFSVHMFSAVINYAYNRVSEDMQAEFDKERRQAHSDRVKRKLANRRSLVTKEQTASAAAAEGQKSQKKSQPAFEHLDDETREKVQSFLNKTDHQHATFKVVSVCMFFLYAATYLWFLWANIAVGTSFELAAAVEAAIEAVEIDVPQRGGFTQYVRWGELWRNSHAQTWLVSALPEVLFAQRSEGPPWCLARWNCVVHMESGSAAQEMVLLTAVRRGAERNEGCLAAPCGGGGAFVGGPGLVPNRQAPRGGLAGSPACPAAAGHALPGSGFEVGGLPCSTSCAAGGELEISCSLDANFSLFTSTIRLAATTHDLFTYNTKTLKAEFALFNANHNVITLVGVTFDLLSSGSLRQSIDLHSMALIDLDGGARQVAATLAQRVFPGVLCVFFSVYFSASLLQELGQSFIRRSKDEQEDGYESRLSITLDFFLGDPFNALEVISILVSLTAAASFAAWLSKDMHLKGALEGSLVDFLNYLRNMTVWHKEFIRLSGVNMLFVFIRPIKFLKDGSVRMAKLWKTLFDARYDIFWFVVFMAVILLGFIMFSWISFGERHSAVDCSTFGRAMVFCVDYLFGRFDFGPLYEADPVMATLFFYPYLVLCYIVVSNTLFAIIDRTFATADPPAVSLKRKFKPFFGRLLRFIEWDNDHTMSQDPQFKKEEGPPTRAKRVHITSQRIATIRETGDFSAGGPAPSLKRARGIPDVCDVDERMQGGMVADWSRDEARKTVNYWSGLAAEKYAYRDEAAFIDVVMKGKEGGREGLEAEEARAKGKMEEAFRHVRYAREVHETMAERDQRSLAQYITVLEQNIQEEMARESALRREVARLREASAQIGGAPEAPPGPAGPGAPRRGLAAAPPRPGAAAAPPQPQLLEAPEGPEDDSESDDSW